MFAYEHAKPGSLITIMCDVVAEALDLIKALKEKEDLSWLWHPSLKKFGTIGVQPYFCSPFDENGHGMPDSIRVVQLILVQYVLVRIQVGQPNLTNNSLIFNGLFCFRTCSKLFLPQFLPPNMGLLMFNTIFWNIYG